MLSASERAVDDMVQKGTFSKIQAGVSNYQICLRFAIGAALRLTEFRAAGVVVCRVTNHHVGCFLLHACALPLTVSGLHQQTSVVRQTGRHIKCMPSSKQRAKPM